MARSPNPPPRPRAKQPEAGQPEAQEPNRLPPTEAARAARQARLAEEMRRNLKKRKARQRALEDRAGPE